MKRLVPVAVLVPTLLVVAGLAQWTPTPVAIPADGPVPLELQFVGVGDLHQRWFADTKIATELSTELGACMAGHTVVKVSYDDTSRIGRIRLVVDTPDSFTCSPGLEDGVSLASLEPVGRALAAYRDHVAGSFDYRVASFRVELEVLSGTKLCEVELGGQFPPDGTTWSPCVNLGGDLQCAGSEEAGLTHYRFEDAAHTAYLAGCFTPS